MAKRTSIFLFFVVIVIGALVALLIWKWDAVVDKLSEKKLEAERRAWIQRTQELEGMIVDLQKGEVEPKPLLPAERLTQVFGPTSPLVTAASPASMNCRELQKALRAFCNYLDATETLRSQKAYRDCWTLLNDIFAILEKSPPTIIGESYRPSIILQNSFFFFRSLGKERINLIREVLKYEADLAEPLMGSLYHWLMKGRKCNKAPSSPANLDVLYQYAGFFLNTLGGHSYLYRRDSRIRLLTIYYAILAVHEANLQGLNELGLDLRFFLPLIFHEIQSRNDLLYAEEYLQKLSDLQLHYFRQE